MEALITLADRKHLRATSYLAHVSDSLRPGRKGETRAEETFCAGCERASARLEVCRDAGWPLTSSQLFAVGGASGVGDPEEKHRTASSSQRLTLPANATTFPYYFCCAVRSGDALSRFWLTFGSWQLLDFAETTILIAVVRMFCRRVFGCVCFSRRQCGRSPLHRTCPDIHQ